MADALFRVDAWAGRTVLSLYIRNARFRDGRSGRKPRTVDILSGARPPFRYQELRLDTQHTFGCVHLPAADQITAVARRITASDGRVGLVGRVGLEPTTGGLLVHSASRQVSGSSWASRKLSL